MMNEEIITRNEISHRIDVLLSKLNEKLTEHNKKHFQRLEPVKVNRDDGKKYTRLVQIRESGAGSAYGFINLTTGDILKAASWKAPAKGVRGNVNDYDYGLSCCDPYGVKYIRGGNVEWD